MLGLSLSIRLTYYSIYLEDHFQLCRISYKYHMHCVINAERLFTYHHSQKQVIVYKIKYLILEYEYLRNILCVAINTTQS